METLDNEWMAFVSSGASAFQGNQEPKATSSGSSSNSQNPQHKLSLSNETEPDSKTKCSPLTISTRTKIAYLDLKSIDVNDVFWKIHIQPYSQKSEGVIKKQIKIVCNSNEELVTFKEKVKQIKSVSIANEEHIDNPGACKSFKYVCKLSVGLSKKDILAHRAKEKKAFYNCFMLILRIKHKGIFKEVNVKVFNTGKISFPGMLDNEVMDRTLDVVTNALNNAFVEPIKWIENSLTTVLVNSNFVCEY